MRFTKLIYYHLASVCLLAFLSPATCLGQVQDGTITGIVTDVTDAVLPGVTVMAINQDTNVQMMAVTGDSGNYTIPRLMPGDYRIEAELPGFKKYVQADVKVGTAVIARLDIQLVVGLVTEEVQVVGESPILHTESAEKGSVIYNEEIIDLPLEGRDFTELAFLTIGVTPRNEGGQGGFATVNGARGDSMNYVVDGGNNNILRGGAGTVRPSLDSVQEFKVQTSNYSAEYGRRSTGVINVVLRSGTNAFHGSLFEFHRNSVLDSANFFDPIRYKDPEGNLTTLNCDGCTYFEKDKSVLVRHNFGGNVGGPIIRDKLFFFFNFEGMQRHQGETRLGVVPTLDQRQGIMKKKVKDPLTGKNFKKKTIPRDRWHPTSAKIMEDWFPLPNISRGSQNYISNKVDLDNWRDWTGKVDWHFGDADNISTRYVFNDRIQDQPFHGSLLPGFGRTGDRRFQLFGITFTHTFTPNFINQTLFNFSRRHMNADTPNLGTDYWQIYGLPGKQTEAFSGVPRIRIQNMTDIGDGGATPYWWVENDFDLNNTITVIKGEHNLRFGGEVIRTQFWQLYQNNYRGTFRFRNKKWTKDAFGDFLLGMMNNVTRRRKATTNYLIATTYAGFFQDDWKITPNFTLNFGVRYDLFIPPHDKQDHWANFNPDTGLLVISGDGAGVELPEDQLAIATFGGSSYPRSLVWSDKNNFAPRLGFAWRLGNSRTVLRAGVGQFFGLTLMNPIRLSMGGNPPFTILERFNRNKKKPLFLTWDNPYPAEAAKLDGITTPEGYEMKAQLGNIYQYNLTIERQWQGDVVSEISYVGSKGTHLGRRYNINRPTFTFDENGEAIAQRNWPQFGNINFYGFDADSNYNAFQASVRKRGRGTNFRLNYSFAKSIDDASRLNGGGGSGASIFPGVQNPWDRDAERALSDFDRRHVLTGSLIYRLPFRNHFLARGWQVNTIVRLYSGTPVSPREGTFNNFEGEAGRPDRIGSGKLDNPTPERWFNVDDFPSVPAGSYRFGNAGRNVVIGPTRKHWSFSFMRNFRMPTEGHRLQFRWEVFNIPNFVNLRAVDERIDKPTAGVISQAYPARQMQVALKYMF